MSELPKLHALPEPTLLALDLRAIATWLRDAYEPTVSQQDACADLVDQLAAQAEVLEE